MGNQAYFKHLKDPEDIDRVLSDAERFNRRSTLWLRGKSAIVQTQIDSINKTSNQISFQVKSAQAARDFKVKAYEQNEEHFFFNIETMSAWIFGRCKIDRLSDDIIRGTISDKLYTVQRRRFFRFELPSRILREIEFTHPKLSHLSMRCRIRDLSEGGIGFWVGLKHIEGFKLGHRFLTIQFRLSSGTIRCQALIKHMRRVSLSSKHADLYLIGVEFDMLSKDVQKQIQDEVLKLARAHFSKLLSK